MIVLNRVSKVVRISYATNEVSKEISDYAWISMIILNGDGMVGVGYGMVG